MYVYVASSWRNPHQPHVVAELERAGVEAYDFRNPRPGHHGFSWRETCPRCRGRQCGTHVPGVGSCVFPANHETGCLTPREADGYHRRCSSCNREPGELTPKGQDHVAASVYLEMVHHPVASEGFRSDFDAMQAADAFVMVLPCGKSAHLELGWATGAGVPSAILLEDPIEPELMYRLADLLTPELEDVVDWLHALRERPPYLKRRIPDVAGRDVGKGLYGGLR